VGKPEEKRQLGRQKCRWVDNIKIDLGEIEWGGMDWIDLARHRDKWRVFVSSVMNIGFHKMLRNYRVAAQLVACRYPKLCHVL
jgi:hypothetical protein